MRTVKRHSYYVTFGYAYRGQNFMRPFAVAAENRDQAEQKAREVFEKEQMPECAITSAKVELLYLAGS